LTAAMDEADSQSAIAELRRIVAELELQLKAHRHVIAEVAAITGDLSWLARLTSFADEHERALDEPLSAQCYRDELDAIAELAAAGMERMGRKP
jgi:hypothetical protein